MFAAPDEPASDGRELARPDVRLNGDPRELEGVRTSLLSLWFTK